MIAGVNELAGESATFVAAATRGGPGIPGLRVAPDDAPVTNAVPDGTEWAVALIVVGALAFLTLLEIGGFRSVIAAAT